MPFPQKELKAKFEYHSSKIWGNIGMWENNLLLNDLLLLESFWEPISSKFNIHFPKELSFLKKKKMHCNFLYIGFVLLSQIKQEQIREGRMGQKVIRMSKSKRRQKDRTCD